MSDAIAAVVRESASRCTSMACLLGWKIGFAAILLVEGMVFGHTVVILKNRVRPSMVEFVVHLGKAMSSGVFLTAGVLLLLPEAVKLLSPDFQKPAALELFAFPTSYVLLLASFYVMFFFEQVLLPRFSKKPILLPVAVPVEAKMDDDKVPSMEWRLRSAASENYLEAALPKDDSSNSESTTESAVSDHKSAELSNVEQDQRCPKQSAFLNETFLRCLLMIVGLSLPSLIKSMALGMADDFPTALHLFIGSASHRWIMAAALGFKFDGYDLTYNAFLTISLTFSLMVPIGVGIGFALSSVSTLFAGLVLILSAGAFIYVGAFQLTAAVFVKHPKWSLSKFAALAAGALVKVLISVVLIALRVRG